MLLNMTLRKVKVAVKMCRIDSTGSPSIKISFLAKDLIAVSPWNPWNISKIILTLLYYHDIMTWRINREIVRNELKSTRSEMFTRMLISPYSIYIWIENFSNSVSWTDAVHMVVHHRHINKTLATGLQVAFVLKISLWFPCLWFNIEVKKYYS